MKTFKQFAEQSDDYPDIIKSLKGIAQQNKMTQGQATNFRDKITSTVFDRLTGGAEGRKKGINKLQKNVNKMSRDMPKAFDKFEKFLGSGKIEKGLNKATTKLNQVMK